MIVNKMNKLASIFLITFLAVGCRTMDTVKDATWGLITSDDEIVLTLEEEKPEIDPESIDEESAVEGDTLVEEPSDEVNSEREKSLEVVGSVSIESAQSEACIQGYDVVSVGGMIMRIDRSNGETWVLSKNLTWAHMGSASGLTESD